MTSKNKTWGVPSRAISKVEIERVESMIMQGLTVPEIMKATNKKEAYVRNLILRHTPGIMRLRQKAKMQRLASENA